MAPWGASAASFLPFILTPSKKKTNLRLFKRWQEVQANEVRYKEYFLDDAEFVIIGFGTAGRVALSAVRAARQQGIKVGLLRPITVSPFPYEVMDELGETGAALSWSPR